MIETPRGLPNTCSKCGKEVDADKWFAETVDAARSGQGLCDSCANPKPAAKRKPRAKKA